MSANELANVEIDDDDVDLIDEPASKAQTQAPQDDTAAQKSLEAPGLDATKELTLATGGRAAEGGGGKKRARESPLLEPASKKQAKPSLTLTKPVATKPAGSNLTLKQERPASRAASPPAGSYSAAIYSACRIP